LSGRRIVVTRTREQASELAAKLARLGAEVIELPVLRISREISKQALADVMLEFGAYDWLVFTSANGVHFFLRGILQDLRRHPLARAHPDRLRRGRHGRAVAELHLKVECQPKTATAEALADELIATGSMDNAKVLVITGNLNRDVLVKRLEEARAIVDCLQVYKTEPTCPGPRGRRIPRPGPTPSSSRAPRRPSLCRPGGGAQARPGRQEAAHGSIGPQTSETMRKAG
jgi:uroporphyrinogen-III synthase